jgi:hypothetical protein
VEAMPRATDMIFGQYGFLARKLRIGKKIAHHFSLN